jgi:hypothetical protein
MNRTCACVRLSALETYARMLTILEVLGVLEQWANTANAAAFFRAMVRTFTAHFDIDAILQKLMPDEHVFRTPIAQRSQTNPECFKATHLMLLNARARLLPTLLLSTYNDHPPTAFEAYRFMRLGDIRDLIDKIASTLRTGTSGVDRYTSKSDMDNHDDHIGFLLDQLEQYGLTANSYREAVQEYAKLLSTIFPSSTDTPPEPANLAVKALPPPYPRIA